MTDARAELAARQAELLAALLAGAPTPDGFSARELEVTASMLLAKRRRIVLGHVDDSIEGVEALFDQYAADHPRRVGQRTHDDVTAFQAWLTDNGHLDRPRRWFRRKR